MYNPELYKGTLKIIVLHLLQKHGKLYGYEIVKLVKELSKEKLILKEGALYPTLHRLEKELSIKGTSFFKGKKIRKYYEIFSKGENELETYKEDFQEFVSTIKKILK